MHYFLAFIIPFFSFLLQSYPRIFNRYFGVDVWTRLLEVEHVRIAKHRIPGKLKKGFIVEGNFDYPILFPWLFSFFPKNLLFKLQGFVSPLFDAVQNVLVFFIAFSLTSDIKIALVSQLIYSLVPMIPIENSYLTPRSLGYTIFTLSFYPLLLFHLQEIPIYLFLSLFFTTALFLTHRFALQSFLFIALFFTFVDKSILYLAVFIFSFILASFITKGHYLRVAKGHLANIYFWVLNYKYRFAHQVYWSEKQKRIDWVQRIYHLLSSFSPIFLLATNVWAGSGIIYLYLYYTNYLSIPKNEVFLKFALWIVFFYVIGSIILKIKRLIPIGEGQRYLEMATVPSAILSSVLLFHFYKQYGSIILLLFILLMLSNLILILFTQIKGVIKDKNRSLTPDLKQVFDYINKLPQTPRIMCIPHQITTMTVYNTKANVLVNADNPGLLRIMDFYPILKKKVSEIAKEHRIDYLLLKESFAKLSDLKLKKAKIVFKSGDVLLVALGS